MTEHTKRGVAIITGIAKTAHSIGYQLTDEQVNELLTLFEHYPVGGDGKYKDPRPLVAKTYSTGDADLTKQVREVFPWFDPKVDRTLLD